MEIFASCSDVEGGRERGREGEREGGKKEGKREREKERKRKNAIDQLHHFHIQARSCQSNNHIVWKILIFTAFLYLKY